jgi:hypothetical protein
MVTEDAELGFVTPDELESLLRQHPDLYPPLLFILGEKVAESREDERTILDIRDQSEQARPQHCETGDSGRQWRS